jgi:hypothetical protein
LSINATRNPSYKFEVSAHGKTTALSRIEFIATTQLSRAFLTSVYMKKVHTQNVNARRSAIKLIDNPGLGKTVWDQPVNVMQFRWPE